jgi:hypothetical protein
MDQPTAEQALKEIEVLVGDWSQTNIGCHEHVIPVWPNALSSTWILPTAEAQSCRQSLEATY